MTHIVSAFNQNCVHSVCKTHLALTQTPKLTWWNNTSTDNFYLNIIKKLLQCNCDDSQLLQFITKILIETAILTYLPNKLCTELILAIKCQFYFWFPCPLNLSKLTVGFLRYSASMVKIEFSNEHHVLSVWIPKEVIGITCFSLVGARFCHYCRLATSLIFYLCLILFYKKNFFVQLYLWFSVLGECFASSLFLY